MSTLMEDPHRAVILGVGRGGTAILEMLLDEELVTVVAVADADPDAVGLTLAREHAIPVYDSIELALRESSPCVAFNMTGNEMIEAVASEILGVGGVVGGMEANLMWRMVSNLKKTREELRFQASHDPLTGLYNRRHMIEQLHQGISQSLRYGHPYTIVMFDLDHFKQVNDMHGHVAGDLALSHMAEVLRKGMREADVPGRWGGEEFLVLLPHTGLNGARAAAEQWLEHLNRSPVKLANGQSIGISFSAGLATFDTSNNPGDIKSIVDQLLHLADERMYAAKAQGRNCVRSSLETDNPDS